MRASKATLILWAVTLFSLSACGTARRFGKDVFIVGSGPLLIPYAAANDAVASSRSASNGLGGGAAIEVLTLPFTFAYHVFEHALYSGVHALDAVLCPLYGAAEISAVGSDIQPLDFYQGTLFDNVKAGTDAESGERRPAGN